ncbi:Heat shock factor protein HSF8 [Hibiscus syriacus]|uniref:Heat shock factor protein HSF8 n=1 Tax=Hibiscus syriacus TaxID=106335 RepID=A0A6A3BMZ2_HIBSY|nr:Heat shock factor protein HSF8 [Hibiscus syriacus]
MDSLHCSISAANTAASNGNAVPPFLRKTYDVVDDPSTNSVISWSGGNNSFVVWKVPEFSGDLLPKKVDPDGWEFANEGFLRGQKHLLKTISGRKPVNVHSNQQPQVPSSPVGACIQVGKFGLKEEVERLKRDKNILMQELVRLRQQQQATDNQLQTVGQRVQVMEQRQQQMMSFVAKAMQSPGFLSQLVQQQNENNIELTGGNKKRRLPREDEENLTGEHDRFSPNGQIVKFQPSLNEAAKAMLHQILKMNASPRLEPSIDNAGAFMIKEGQRGNAEYIDPMSAVLNAANPIETCDFSTDHNVDILLDGTSKLPAISDAFWEQFLSTIPSCEDTDEINSSYSENGASGVHELLLGKDNGWDGIQHMNHRMEQMGLLTSNSQRG